MSFGVYRGKPGWVLWMCYVTIVLMGIGALRRNGFLIASQLNIVAAPLVFWNIDFCYHLLTGQALWGTTEYWFKELLLISRLISLEHFFVVPIGLYLLYLVKIERRDHWKMSWATISLLFMITYFFTNPVENVNCVFEPCIRLLSQTFYPFTFLAFLYAMSLVTGLIINRVPFFQDRLK